MKNFLVAASVLAISTAAFGGPPRPPLPPAPPVPVVVVPGPVVVDPERPRRHHKKKLRPRRDVVPVPPGAPLPPRLPRPPRPPGL